MSKNKTNKLLEYERIKGRPYPKCSVVGCGYNAEDDGNKGSKIANPRVYNRLVEFFNTKPDIVDGKLYCCVHHKLEIINRTKVKNPSRYISDVNVYNDWSESLSVDFDIVRDSKEILKLWQKVNKKRK